jgi:hypothetical protein
VSHIPVCQHLHPDRTTNLLLIVINYRTLLRPKNI